MFRECLFVTRNTASSQKKGIYTILQRGCTSCYHIYFYCAVMLHIINYIYYKVPKIEIGFNEAEQNLEFNRSMFIVIAALPFKSARDGATMYK